jgi:catechol 2,3-dioxygenase-like lactoylglutathione lyase family enzyme
MQISSVVAQLRTTDLAASIRFYTTLPGFTLAFRHEEQNCLGLGPQDRRQP